MFELLRSSLLSKNVAKISGIESSGTLTDPDTEGDGKNGNQACATPRPKYAA
jgi:hypothetical protein